MEKIIINVYNDENEVVKTCEAKIIDIKFGTIRKLMDLLKIDDINDTSELLKTVYGAWDQITRVLDQCFPDMEEEDWDGVLVNELLPVILQIARATFGEMLKVPKTNPKN